MAARRSRLLPLYIFTEMQIRYSYSVISRELCCFVMVRGFLPEIWSCLDLLFAWTCGQLIQILSEVVMVLKELPTLSILTQQVKMCIYTLFALPVVHHQITRANPIYTVTNSYLNPSTPHHKLSSLPNRNCHTHTPKYSVIHWEKISCKDKSDYQSVPISSNHVSGPRSPSGPRSSVNTSLGPASASSSSAPGRAASIHDLPCNILSS